MKTFFKVFLIHFSLLVLLGVSFMSGFSFHPAEAVTFIYWTNDRDDPGGLDSIGRARLDGTGEPELDFISGTAPWGCVPSSGPLAVNLAFFNIDLAEGAFTLRWETAAEIDNAGFSHFLLCNSLKLASQFCKNLNFVTAWRHQGRSQRKRRRRRRQHRREQRKKRRRRR